MRRVLVGLALLMALLVPSASAHDQPYCGHGSYATGNELVVYQGTYWSPNPWQHVHDNDHFRLVVVAPGIIYWVFTHGQDTQCGGTW